MDCILLLLEQRENRRILAEWLGTRYEVLCAEPQAELPARDPDLILIDAPALAVAASRLSARRQAVNPVVLPVLLLTTGRGQSIPHWVWDCVDEIIQAPIEKPELKSRVDVLLRLRRLSRQLSKRVEDLSARLGRVLDDSPDEIYVIDAGTLRFVQTNQGAGRSLGYTSEELLRKTLFDLEPACERGEHEARLRPLVSGEQSQVIYETEHRRADGSRYPVEVRLQYSASETPPVFVAVVQDITDRRRAAEARAEANRQAMDAEVEKRRFARDVLCAVTQNRFLLVDRSEIPTPGRLVLDLPTRDGPEYRQARRAIQDLTEGIGMPDDRSANLVLAAGEAIGNALKHAVNGSCQVYTTDDQIAIRVSDEGTGMRWEDLPSTVLTAGYSTKVSLGVGYTLILQLADCVWLATGPSGTVVQLQASILPKPEPSTAEYLEAAMDRLGAGW